MPILSFTDLELAFAGTPVLVGASGALEKAEKIGLVGPNGCGKTTLLRILAGEMRPDGGSVALARGSGIAYLTQRPEPPPGKTLHDWALEGLADLAANERELDGIHEELARAAGERQQNLLERQGALQPEFERRQGYDAARRAEAVLTGLGFRPDQLEVEAVRLSGGEKSRGALARILLQEPDVLLLDEPTNHLDLEELEWLEEWLRGSREAAIVVSHDRYFLDRVASRIFAVERGAIAEYRGNYSRFLELRAEKRARAEKEKALHEEFVDKQREFIRRFKAGQRAKEAAGREKRLDRLIDERAAAGLSLPPELERDLSFRFPEPGRAGEEVLAFRRVTAGYGATCLFRDLDLEVRRRDRIGAIGPNGCGKTTLLRIGLGEVAPRSGEAKVGASVAVGAYRQEGDDLDPAKTVLDEVHDSAPREDLLAIRTLLGRLGFSDVEQEKPIAGLSGGERARVSIAKLILERPNFLVLDEPTNHLDLNARHALEAALAGFDGTVLAVSHDRYFLDKVATKVLAFGPGGPKLWTGNYSEYKAKLAARAATAAAASATASPPSPAQKPVPKPASPKPDRSAASKVKKRHTFEELEAKIMKAEDRLRKVEAGLQSPANARDHQKLKDLSAEFEKTRKELEALNAEWEVWAEELGRAGG